MGALKNDETEKKCAENALRCAETKLVNNSDEIHSCGNSTDSNSSMNNVIECKYCQKTFKQKRYLRQHYKRNNCKAYQ